MSRTPLWNILHVVTNNYIQRVADLLQKLATYLIIRLIPYSDLTWAQVSRNDNLESYSIMVRGKQIHLPISSEIEAVQGDFQFNLIRQVDDSVLYTQYTPLEGVSFYATPQQMGGTGMFRINLLDNSQQKFAMDQIPNYDS
jgi:hypothetical protein